MAKSGSDNAYYLLGLRALADFGATIAVPAVIASMLGAKLDAAWGSKPYATLSFLALAFVLTAALIRKKAVAYGKSYQELISKKP
jgi:F0F1-type ATP synthase assembly protein I